jgi:hypothetical protein
MTTALIVFAAVGAIILTGISAQLLNPAQRDRNREHREQYRESLRAATEFERSIAKKNGLIK